MSSKKSASRAAVIERDEKPVEREGEEMNTKYAEQTQNRQAREVQKTQKAKNTEKKQREQPGRKEKAGQTNPEEQGGAAGQVQAADLTGAAGQIQPSDLAGAAGQSGAAGQPGTTGQTGIAGQPETAGQEHPDLEKDMYLISETAKLVGVESHVLRYWEEELKLPIRRNELGHRYYTREDVEQFREIKKLKQQGLQLKAIRTVLTDSTLQVMVPIREHIQPVRSTQAELNERDDRQLQDKSARLQLLLHNLVAQAVRENNQDLTREIKETIMKEMDYQFRIQEEENEKRDRQRTEREEEHYKKLDELIKQYSGRGLTGKERRERKRQAVKERKAQAPAQEPHSIQVLASITYCPSPAEIAPTGHCPSHVPQLTQASLITYAIMISSFILIDFVDYHYLF